MHAYLDPFDRPWQGNLDGVRKGPPTTQESLTAIQADLIYQERMKVESHEKSVRQAMATELRVLREALHDKCEAEGGHMFRIWSGGNPICDRCGLKGWEAERWIEGEQRRLSAGSTHGDGMDAPPADGSAE